MKGMTVDKRREKGKEKLSKTAEEQKQPVTTISNLVRRYQRLNMFRTWKEDEGQEKQHQQTCSTWNGWWWSTKGSSQVSCGWVEQGIQKAFSERTTRRDWKTWDVIAVRCGQSRSFPSRKRRKELYGQERTFTIRIKILQSISPLYWQMPDQTEW